MLQGTNEWLEAKIGHVGNSRLGDVLAEGVGITRKNYMMELVCQRLTGKRPDQFTSDAMRWGTEYEPIARSMYEAKTGVMVQEHFGQEHPLLSDWWCSPDGLVGEDGGIEIKCPNTATHLNSLLNGKVATDYIYQMTGLCLVYERTWCDFISFDPRLPDNCNLFIKRFDISELPVDKVYDGVKLFIKELLELEQKLRSMQ